MPKKLVRLPQKAELIRHCRDVSHRCTTLAVIAEIIEANNNSPVQNLLGQSFKQNSIIMYNLFIDLRYDNAVRGDSMWELNNIKKISLASRYNTLFGHGVGHLFHYLTVGEKDSHYRLTLYTFTHYPFYSL